MKPDEAKRYLAFLDRTLEEVKRLPDSEPEDHLSDEEFAIYTTENLLEEDKARIEGHLARCPDCKSEMDWFLKESSGWRTAEGEGELNALAEHVLANDPWRQPPRKEEEPSLQAAAAVIVDLRRENLFTPLPPYEVREILAQAAADGAIESVERGEIDFVPTKHIPPGTMVEASDTEKTIMVVVPCLDPFDKEPPGVELLLEGEKARSTDLKKQPRHIRVKAGDPGSLQKTLCWVAYFAHVPLGRMIITVATPRQPQGKEHSEIVVD